MPTRLRSLLLAFALAAFVVGSAAAPDRDAPTPLIGVKSATAHFERVLVNPRRYVAKRKRTIGERAATIALKAVGVPYRWGGASPSSGFDCSGLVYWAYGRLGVEVPHSSYALFDQGRRVARARMRPGDVLFFSGLGHVGLYVGDGRMVHAPHSGRRVEVVTLGRSRYGERLIGARRLVDPV
jgi:cell wall-associated NlpC family hydrolase